MIRTAKLTALACAGALALTACGGSGGSDSGNSAGDSGGEAAASSNFAESYSSAEFKKLVFDATKATDSYTCDVEIHVNTTDVQYDIDGEFRYTGIQGPRAQQTLKATVDTKAVNRKDPSESRDRHAEGIAIGNKAWERSSDSGKFTASAATAKMYDTFPAFVYPIKEVDWIYPTTGTWTQTDSDDESASYEIKDPSAADLLKKLELNIPGLKPSGLQLKVEVDAAGHPVDAEFSLKTSGTSPNDLNLSGTLTGETSCDDIDSTEPAEAPAG